MKSRTPLTSLRTAGLCVLVLLTGMVREAAADLFASDSLNNKIYRYTVDGVRHTFASVNWPYGLAFDTANNLYVADYSDIIIYKFRPNGQRSVFASGDAISRPLAVAFDSAGNLFVSHESTSYGIAKITPSGTITNFVSGMATSGLAFDSAGYLYADDSFTRDILKIAPDGTITSFAHGFNQTWDLKFDSTGNLFVSDWVAGTIYKITPEGLKTTFASLFQPMALLFDRTGFLFVSANLNYQGDIYEFTPDGRHFTFATGPLADYFAIPYPR